MDTPRVFIASTLEDLRDHREAAVRAVRKLQFIPIESRDWPSRGSPPLETCLKEVDGIDVVIVIVAHRHGWTPPTQKAGESKSITRLECEQAHGRGVEVIPFMVNPNERWDHTQTESFRFDSANPDDAKAVQEILRDIQSLKSFKSWLDCVATRRLFATVADVERDVYQALSEWAKRRDPATSTVVATADVREQYLTWVRRTCESVELLGLDAKDSQSVRLGHVYVPAVTQNRLREDTETDRDANLREADHKLLLHALGESSLYVPGAPGAGKSTFCRWVALTVANGAVAPHPVPPPDEFLEVLPESLVGLLPVVCELRRWATHEEYLKGNGRWAKAQLEDSLGRWIGSAKPHPLTRDVFLDALRQGECLLIFDGVDEVPEVLGAHRPRRNLISGLADALPDWHAAGNRILLTSRPYGLSAKEQASLSLHDAPLAELPEPLQGIFVRRWYAAVDRQNAEEKANGLLTHLADRADLSELRGNPMLLTALCVKYGEGQRLPQDFYKLYDALIEQVLYKRYETDSDREAARRRLAAVALGMHRGPDASPRVNPAAEVTYEEADGILERLLVTDIATEQGAADVALMRDGLLSDSGLLLPRPEKRAGFYHLSFQEFLAAIRLRTVGEATAEILGRHASSRYWHRTLLFLFCAIADRDSPEAALKAFGVLEPLLAPAALSTDPAPALLLASCLDVAHARGWKLDRFRTSLRSACDYALEHVAPAERALLWLTLGRQGWDDRPGVGVRDGLPDIEWVEVPAGEFIYGEDGEKGPLDAFRIARHPVTHCQFQCFIDDGGYSDARWWEGLAEHPQPERSGWSEPNAPREMVSWFEAVAFSRWLTAKLREAGTLGSEDVVRLPTEFEWEKAARGSDGREFPWGDYDMDGRANVEGHIDRTTPAGLYAEGASPCGAMDMAGNVFEWCLTDYEKPANASEHSDVRRVVRGGSWYGDRRGARCAYRGDSGPGNRSLNLGLRLLCVSPIP
jgi:formylglycine-generating enzyme required for sulfatase activity